MVNFGTSKITEKSARWRHGLAKIGSNPDESRRNRPILNQTGASKVNSVACYHRTPTVVPFTLLMGLNRPAFAFGDLSRPAARVGDIRLSLGVDQGRRSFRNFSKNRPETTNLNHQ
jgi:hypothetical protein